MSTEGKYRFALSSYNAAKADAKFLREFGPKVPEYVRLHNLLYSHNHYVDLGMAIGWGDDRGRPARPTAYDPSREEMLSFLPTAKDLAARVRESRLGRQMLSSAPLDWLLTKELISDADQKAINDVLTQLNELCTTELKSAKRHVFNPLVWFRDGLVLLLGLPLYLLALTGVDLMTAKTHLAKSLVQVIWVLLLIFILFMLGMRSLDIAGAITSLMGGGPK